MNDRDNKKISEKVLAYFEKNAPRIVKKSVNSLYLERPVVDFYDTDFYVSNLAKARAFKRIGQEKLRKIIDEHIDEIDVIFFKNFKDVKFEKTLDFGILERKKWRLDYIVFAIFLFISTTFLYIAEKYGGNPLLIDRIVHHTLDLKLSAGDIADLFTSIDTDKWVSVKIIESKRSIHNAKIKHKPDSSFDFQLNIAGMVYNLFNYEGLRKDVYGFFKTAEKWGIDSTSPEFIQLKINKVLLGIFIMEKKIYEKIRDDKGNYYITLGSNSEKMRTLLYLIPKTGDKMLSKYFDKKELASYLVFFSLFSYNEVLDFDRLLFRYYAKKKKYKPFLTLNSVISSLKTQDTTFEPHLGEEDGFFTRITKENVANLLEVDEYFRYKEFVKIVFEDLL